MTTQAKKKTSWSYQGSIATVKFPDGVTESFDTEDVTAPEARLFLFHYGYKQFLSDKIAGIGKGATTEDKLTVFKEYHELLKAGDVKKAVERKAVKKPTLEQFIAEAKGQGIPEKTAKVLYEKLYVTK